MKTEQTAKVVVNVSENITITAIVATIEPDPFGTIPIVLAAMGEASDWSANNHGTETQFDYYGRRYFIRCESEESE